MPNADEINPVTVKNKVPQLRLFRLVPLLYHSQTKRCWHCGEQEIHKLIWCYRCYFYVQNNFNDLEP